MANRHDFEFTLLVAEGSRHGWRSLNSADLRAQVVAAVERKSLSRRQAAPRFGVSYGAAINWLKRYREITRRRPVALQ